MKKKFFMLGILSALILAVGCSKTTDNQKENQKVENITEQKEDGNSKNGLLDLEKYNLDYNFETDAQPYFIWGKAAKSENGYYLLKTISDGSILMFYDLSSKQFVPVCNQPNCKHKGSSCNAYLRDIAHLGEDDCIDNNYIQYQNGYLYMLGCDKENYVSLYRLALDGSTREKYMRLYKKDDIQKSDNENSLWRTPEVCIHRGYVYFIDEYESMPKIRRMKLGDKETEVVYETSGERPTLYRMEAYGDYLFFQTGKYKDEECLEVKGGIYAYNIQNGNISLVKEDAISSYILCDSEIYYSDEKEIRKYSMETGKDEKVLDYPNGYADLGIDKNYIYTVSFDGKMEIYEKESKELVYEKEFSDSTEIFFGDENFLFGKWTFKSESAEAREELKYFDKTKLKNKEGEWEILS